MAECDLCPLVFRVAHEGTASIVRVFASKLCFFELVHNGATGWRLERRRAVRSRTLGGDNANKGYTGKCGKKE